MSSDRLKELHRQRDAVQAHLNWLDTEIARESSAAVASTNSASQPAPPRPTIEVPLRLDYEPDPVSAAADARKGCLVWMLAFLLLGLALISAIYFWRYRDHPLFFSSENSAARTAAITQSS